MSAVFLKEDQVLCQLLFLPICPSTILGKYFAVCWQQKSTNAFFCKGGNKP
jgi:hypothetical protein